MTMLLVALHRLRTTALLAFAALALVLTGSAGAGSGSARSNPAIHVDTTVDAPDAVTSDGKCWAKILTQGGHHCTLRAAVQTANARPGNDVIVVPAGTFKLGVAGTREDKAATGDLDVRPDVAQGGGAVVASGGAVTLSGNGPAATIIDGGGIDRVFDVGIWGELSLVGVSIKGGNAPVFKSDGDGGGIRVGSRGKLTLLRVVLDSNTAAGQLNHGGGLAVGPYASARLARVSLIHNVAGAGAGIYTEGAIDLTNVTIAGNNASNLGGGIVVWSPAQSVVKGVMSHVTVTGNTAANGGSALYLGSALAYLGSRSSIVEGACGGGLNQYLSGGGNVATSNCGTIGAGTVDKLAADPGLGVLITAPGGFPVVPLTAKSPARDFAHGDPCPLIDERGVKRPQGADCDSGAYELASP